jgi:hypothetical protein
MSAPQTYSKAVHEETGWWGTFPIELPLKVGDILQQDSDGGMKRITNIQNLGLTFPTDSESVTAAASRSRHATRSRATTAEGGVTVATGGGAQAAVKVSFSEVAGFVLDYVAGKYEKLRDVSIAKKTVLGLAKNGQWESNYVLVAELLEASPATVLVSSARNSSIVLSASVDVPDNLATINLADPKLGFSSSSTVEGVYQSVSAKSFPLYHCIKVRRKWWGGRVAELQGGVTVNMDDAFTDNPFDEDV